MGPFAEQGDATAQYNLGLMYDNGRGVPRSYAAAVQWYRKAAEQGHAGAQYSLGLMYDIGQGVPQDYATASSWYRKAAVQGRVARDILPPEMPDSSVTNATVTCIQELYFTAAQQGQHAPDTRLIGIIAWQLAAEMWALTERASTGTCAIAETVAASRGAAHRQGRSAVSGGVIAKSGHNRLALMTIMVTAPTERRRWPRGPNVALYM